MKRSKRERIIDGAVLLFNEYGIHKVTVQEICDCSGASKGTFYKYFANKDDLLAVICAQLAEDGAKGFVDIMAQRQGFKAVVEDVLTLKRQLMGRYHRRFLIDLYQCDNPQVQKTLKKMHEDSRQNAMAMYELGIKESKINPRITPEFFVYQLEIVEKTRTDPRVIQIYPDETERNMVVFGQFFYGLLSRE